jgi:hypothetical protein
MRVAAIAILVVSAACAVAAPLVGLAIAGLPLEPYLDFPPRTQWAPAAPFAWDAFALLSVPLLGAIALFGCAIALARPAPASIPRRPFPAWGWIGIGIGAAGWIMAWSDDVVPASGAGTPSSRCGLATFW